MYKQFKRAARTWQSRRDFGSFTDIVLWHELRLAYVTVPKTANTTIKTVLAETLGIMTPDWRTELRCDPQHIHRLLRETPGRRYLASDRSAARGFQAFATVRHPVSRFISFYTDKIAGEGWPVHARNNFLRAYGLTGEESLEQCAQKLLGVPDRHAEIHFRSQSSILDQSPWAHQIQIFRMEALGDLWHWLAESCGREGYEMKTVRPRLNSTSSAATPVISEGVEALIRKRYADDFARLGY